eukprot:gene5177-5415_t
MRRLYKKPYLKPPKPKLRASQPLMQPEWDLRRRLQRVSKNQWRINALAKQLKAAAGSQQQHGTTLLVDTGTLQALLAKIEALEAHLVQQQQEEESAATGAARHQSSTPMAAGVMSSGAPGAAAVIAEEARLPSYLQMRQSRSLPQSSSAAATGASSTGLAERKAAAAGDVLYGGAAGEGLATTSNSCSRSQGDAALLQSRPVPSPLPADNPAAAVAAALSGESAQQWQALCISRAAVGGVERWSDAKQVAPVMSSSQHRRLFALSTSLGLENDLPGLAAVDYGLQEGLPRAAVGRIYTAAGCSEPMEMPQDPRVVLEQLKGNVSLNDHIRAAAALKGCATNAEGGAMAVNDIYHSLKAALDVFKLPADPSSDAPGKKALIAAAERIKVDSAKSSTPPEDQLLGLASELQRSCVAFCSMVHQMTAAAGPTFKEELIKLTQGVVNPCLVLVMEMANSCDLKPLVGRVAKTPADNKSCLFAKLTAVLTVVKDVIREMQELEQQQQEQYGDAPLTTSPGVGAAVTTSLEVAGQCNSSTDVATAAQAADEPGAEQPDTVGECSSSSSLPTASEHQPQHHPEQRGLTDLEYDVEEMTCEERQLLGSSLQLLEASACVLKEFSRALLQGPGQVLAGDALDSWESCLFHARHLKTAVEDLGASLYPPQVWRYGSCVNNLGVLAVLKANLLLFMTFVVQLRQ